VVKNIEVRLIASENYFIWRTVGKTLLDSKRNEVNTELQIYGDSIEETGMNTLTGQTQTGLQ
jgi:chaperonin cofactor prefoldin